MQAYSKNHNCKWNRRLQLLTLKTCNCGIRQGFMKKSLCGAITVTCLEKHHLFVYGLCIWPGSWGGGVCLVAALSPDVMVQTWGMGFMFPGHRGSFVQEIPVQQILLHKGGVKGQLVLGTRAQWMQYILVDLSKDLGQRFYLEAWMLVI